MATWNKGVPRSEATKLKISEALTGRIFSKDHKRKLSEALKGKHRSEATKLKISEALKGHLVSDATKHKLSEAHKGKTLSKTHRLKISETIQRLYAKGKIVNSFQGKRHSDTTKRMMSEAKKGEKNPLYGKHRSEATKLKISEASKGKPKSEVAKRKMSETWKRLYAENEITAYWKGKHHSEETKRKLREARLEQVFPTEDTGIEVLMQNELKRRGIAFDIHVPLLGICQPDIVIAGEKRIVVQCDGDYWHNLPKMRAKDRRQDRALRKAGLKVYRFWEHEINKDASACVNQVIEGMN